MIFPTNYDIANLYSVRRSKIVESIFSSSSFYFNLLEKKRLGFELILHIGTDYFSEIQKLNEFVYINDILSSIESQSNFFLKSDFFLPIPKGYAFFDNKLAPEEFWKIIYDNRFFCEHYKVVKKIIKNSNLDNPTIPFRTLHTQGKSYVFGYNDYSFLSLSRLSHEIGHCLFETLFPIRNWKDQIYSEVFASMVEEEIPKDYLKQVSPCNEVDWVQYQRTVDFLNCYAFLFEIKYFFKIKVERKLDFFNGKVFILRESLYTLPGYQLAYLYSSLNKLLDILPSNADNKLLKSRTKNGFINSFKK